jgi:hypothetical protein
MSAEFVKAPGAELDYLVDWTLWLSGAETISTSNWTVITPGITLVAGGGKDPSIENAGTATKFWVSGGTLYQTYTLENDVVTDAGRTEVRQVDVYIANKAPGD